MSEEDLEKIYGITTKKISEVEKLRAKPKEREILVLFVPDKMEYGLGNEILVEIKQIPDRPEITSEVLDEVTKRVGRTLKDIAREWKSKEPERIIVLAKVFGNSRKTSVWLH